jgi:hypothetical protein
VILSLLGGEPIPSPPWSPDDAREAADRILADDRYREPTPSIIERVLDWISERLADVFGGIVGAGGSNVVGWFLLLVAVGAIVFFVLRLGGTVQVDRRVAEAEVMIELTRSPAEWRADAARLEREGRCKEAVRSLYRALVAELVARDLIPEIPGRTAGEYVRDIATAAPDHAAAFAAATELFELAWYADAPTGTEECARFRTLSSSVLGERART